MIKFLDVLKDKNYLFRKISNLSTCKKFIIIFLILFFNWTAISVGLNIPKMQWSGFSSFFPTFLNLFLEFLLRSLLVYFFSKALKGKGNFSNTILGLGVAQFPLLLIWIPTVVYFTVMLFPVLWFNGIIIMLSIMLIFLIFLYLLSLDYSISIIKTVHLFSRGKAFGIIIISIIIAGCINTILF